MIHVHLRQYTPLVCKPDRCHFYIQLFCELLLHRFVEDDEVCIDAIIYVFQDLYNYDNDVSVKRDQILNCFLDGDKLEPASFLHNFESLGDQFIYINFRSIKFV